MKLINYDKFLHFLINFSIVQCSIWLDYFHIGVLTAVIVSVAKELYDKYIKKTKFDWYDILADAAGIALASLEMLKYE